MENKFLTKAQILLSKINYLSDEEITELESIGNNLIEDINQRIKIHGEIGLMYFIDQYNEIRPFYKTISDKIEDHHKTIRRISFDKLEDSRLPNIDRFGEIWVFTMFRLNEIKETYFDKKVVIKDKKESLKNISDLLNEKYKPKEKEIKELLGIYFPDHYDENGNVTTIKRYTKGILSIFRKNLKSTNILIPKQFSVQEKIQVCTIFSNTFLNGKSIDPKTLFEDPIWEVKFTKEITGLKNALKKN